MKLIGSAFLLFSVVIGAKAFATTNYHVTPTTGCTIARGIGNRVEIDVNCNGTLNVISYYLASNSSGYILDPTAIALITTPAANFSDFNMQCTSAPSFYNGNEYVYNVGPTGSGQNCTLFINTSN